MTNPTSDPLPLAPDLVPGVRIKAALLLVLLFSLLLAAGLFLLKSRGFFDPTQRLVLVADNSEGVAPGKSRRRYYSSYPVLQRKFLRLAETTPKKRAWTAPGTGATPGHCVTAISFVLPRE